MKRGENVCDPQDQAIRVRPGTKAMPLVEGSGRLVGCIDDDVLAASAIRRFCYHAEHTNQELAPEAASVESLVESELCHQHRWDLIGITTAKAARNRLPLDHMRSDRSVGRYSPIRLGPHVDPSDALAVGGSFGLA